MSNEKVWLKIFAYFLTALFGILLTAVVAGQVANPVELFIFFVLFSASAGLIFQRPWARKLVRAASIGGIVYFIFKQFVMVGKADIPILALIGIFAIVFYFYRSESLARFYKPENVNAKKWTILVVDDDLTFVKLVKSHFVKQGVTVISSDSGERGLEMAKRWKPDLIILDVILPGMKGRSVCAKLKEDPDTEGIPVMFVTFKNSLDDISAEMELGAVMHLTKPVNYDYLYEQAYKILIKG